MKKILCLLLSLALLLSLCACSSDEQGEKGTGASAEDEKDGINETIPSYVTIGDTKLSLGDVFDEETEKALGEPVNVEELPSCHYDGSDSIYTYESFTVYTYLLEEKKIVYSIELTTDALSTPDGVKVGMTREEVEGVYGTDYDDVPNGISYNLTEDDQLNFRFDDSDKVIGIEYYSE